jgi:hypothetical protein
MRKAHLLLALSVLLVISIVITLIICWVRPHESMTTLKVVFNGPFVLVRTQSKPDVITLFSPRDPHHKFYSNNLKEGTSQEVHIALDAEGLKSGKDLLVDQYYPRDFIMQTDVWDSTKEHLATIELPLPERITFVPGRLHSVTFENGQRSLQVTNFVLEYKVTDLGKIHFKSSGLNGVSPLSSSELQAQFAALCGQMDPREEGYESCIDIRNLLEECAGAKTKVLFFGVGVPYGMQYDKESHAVEFFNLMLESFPNLKGKRLINPANPYDRRGPGSPTTMLMETSFRPAAPRPRLLPVTAVIDCKAGNLIVTAKTTQ